MKKIVLGNEAVARGAWEAGVRVVASYPSTPSTEITETAAQYDEVYCEWAPNEKVAAEVALGASFAGARSLSCMKHVGLNVMADPVFTASYTGVNGGLVFCVADDPGMHSSQNEQDSRHYARAAKMPMLEPSDSTECHAFAKAAFDLSERFDTPVFLRLSTRVSHSQNEVEMGERNDVGLKDYVKNPAKYVMTPANARPRHVFVEQRLCDLKIFAETCDFNRVENHGSKTGVITAGISYEYAREALGDKVDYLKLGLVFPLPEEKLKAFAAAHDTVWVLEELDPFVEDACRALGLTVRGKAEFSPVGEYTAQKIASVVLGVPAPKTVALAQSLPPRPPVMCPGCPHRGTFYVLKKLGLTVAGDIGCYTLGSAAPLEAIDTTVCMGASVSGALGMAKARPELAKKLVSVIGDSTFLHSGMTGLADVVYNGGSNTVIILDNSITGMTGHQQNPATGVTIKGEKTRRIDLEKLCRGLGVERVRVEDPFDVKGFEKAVKEEISADEPSVIIARRPCALLKGVHYDALYTVTDACKHCGLCMKLGCPAISAKEGKTTVDPSLCAGCGLCAGVCPFGAIQKEAAR